jgi:predicted RNA-binding Zn ribbon-like protein
MSGGVIVAGSQPGSGAEAAGRFRVTAASGELRLVQELLNTAALPMNPVGAPDLLDAPDTAAAWFAAAGVPADRPGLRDLQALRDALRQSLVRRDHEGQADADANEAAIEVPVRARLDRDGTVALTPGSDSAAGLRERVLVAVHDAQVSGAWRRLKVCRNPDCRVAFWDSSRNTSAVWHDVRTCGNIANLRNSRARQKQMRGPSPAPSPSGPGLPLPDGDPGPDR